MRSAAGYSLRNTGREYPGGLSEATSDWCLRCLWQQKIYVGIMAKGGLAGRFDKELQVVYDAVRESVPSLQVKETEGETDELLGDIVVAKVREAILESRRSSFDNLSVAAPGNYVNILGGELWYGGGI